MSSNALYLLYALGIFLFRYNRVIVQARALRRAKPIPVPNDLPFCKDDVTVVIPTICEDDQLDFFKRTLESVNRTEPHAIIVVTPVTQARSIRKLAASVDKMIEVVGSPCKGKRYQLCLGLSRVRTAITVCADDDVEWRWEDAALLHLLAPFANPHIGAVGTCQQVERTRSRNLPEFFGALYITRRNHETVATNFIDGGLSCLSGRTFAIRTTILQGNQFSEEYLGEKWRGHCLNPDDDNFITRWVWRHEYKIQIQSAEEVVVHTTLATTFSKYLSQCIRWERSRWRHTFTLVTKYPHIWRMQPWSTWALYYQVLFHSLWTEPVMAFFWYKSIGSYSGTSQLMLTTLLISFMLWAKFLKTIKHYQRNPKDLLLFPLAVLFGYLHGFIKLYAFCTLSNVSWGSRNVNEDESASSSANASTDPPNRNLLRRRSVAVST